MGWGHVQSTAWQAFQNVSGQVQSLHLGLHGASTGRPDHQHTWDVGVPLTHKTQPNQEESPLRPTVASTGSPAPSSPTFSCGRRGPCSPSPSRPLLPHAAPPALALTVTVCGPVRSPSSTWAMVMRLSWASKGLETELDTQVDDGAWHATPTALHARCQGASEHLCCCDHTEKRGCAHTSSLAPSCTWP